MINCTKTPGSFFGKSHTEVKLKVPFNSHWSFLLAMFSMQICWIRSKNEMCGHALPFTFVQATTLSTVTTLNEYLFSIIACKKGKKAHICTKNGIHALSRSLTFTRK